MFQRIKVFSVFVKRFAHYTTMVGEVLMCLIGLILLGGVIISIVEDLDLSAAIYFACITGLTVGYGDITPQTDLGRMISAIVMILGYAIIAVPQKRA